MLEEREMRSGRFSVKDKDVKYDCLIVDLSCLTLVESFVGEKNGDRVFNEREEHCLFANMNFDSSHKKTLGFNVPQCARFPHLSKKDVDIPVVLLAEGLTLEEQQIFLIRAKALNISCFKPPIPEGEEPHVFFDKDSLDDFLEKKGITNSLFVYSEEKSLEVGFSSVNVLSIKSIVDFFKNEFHVVGSSLALSAVSEDGCKSKEGLEEAVSDGVKILFFDIDGTCTDGFKIYSADGNEFKRFSRESLSAMKNACKEGYKIVFLTGDRSEIPEFLADFVAGEIKGSVKISLEEFFYENQNVMFAGGLSSKEKPMYVRRVCESLNANLENVIYFGDGGNDIPAMRFVLERGGRVFCPKNAEKEVKELKGVESSTLKGGYGFVANLIRYLLEELTEEDEILQLPEELTEER